MEWLSQNWVWIAVAVGGYFLMSRMGIGGCGMGHSHGGGHANGGRSAASDRGSNDQGPDGTNLFDPVSQQMLPSESAIASVYCGRVYYFKDRTNRDAFETEPEKYLAGSQAIGQAAGSSTESNKHSHQGHGCC